MNVRFIMEGAPKLVLTMVVLTTVLAALQVMSFILITRLVDVQVKV